MKKCINLYYDYSIDTLKKFEDIISLGYDGVLLEVNDSKYSMTISEQVEFARNHGLEIPMIHCSYYEPDLDNFWLDNIIGDSVEKMYIDQIYSIKDLGVKDFVVHLCGTKDTICSPVGITRLHRMLDVCSKCNIDLNIENLHSYDQLMYVFDNIKHPNLKFCFDCGHANFLTPGKPILELLNPLCVNLHLHDNFGVTDDHFVLGMGNIDIDALCVNLANLNPNVMLTSEIKFKKMPYSIDTLKNNLDMLNLIENKIKQIQKEKK